MTHLKLDLNKEELPMLAELLRQAVGDIQSEIRDAESAADKHGLQHRREVLLDMANRVGFLSGAELHAVC